jgi:hypothetical protein
MSWFNSAKRNESAVSKLPKKVFTMSLSCAETLKPDLEKKFGKDRSLFGSKYIQVLFEFMYFFIHLTDRYAFSQLGNERRSGLYDELVPATIEASIETLFGHCPQNIKEGIEKDFYSNLNNSQMDYGSCKELLLDQKDDIRTFEKLKSCAKSKSMIGQLTDNLSQVIQGEINLNPLFTISILEVVLESLKKKELQILVSEASSEIK